MSDRTREGMGRSGDARHAHRRARRPGVEALEGRALMATLAPIANVSVPANLGYQVPLNGGAGANQTFSVTSSNPAVQASVAQGQFLTINVTHTSSGASDPAFTGSMTFQLFEDLTPITAAHIEELVQQGFYTSPTSGSPSLPDKNFHRVASGFPGANDFIVQGGSQSGNGSGSLNQPGFPFQDEYNQQLVYDGTGQLAMANAGNDTNDSQFYITTGMPRFLDFNKTIFGQLVSGFDILTDMTQVARGSDGTTPVNPILMNSTTLSTTNPNGVIHLSAVGTSAGQTANITVTATDPSGATTSQTFQAAVVANNDTSGQPITERPFLGTVQNQVVGAGQTDVFALPTVIPTPGDQVTYMVGGGVSTDATNPTFTSVSNATASVDANGVVTVTPNSGFTGVINLLVGVRDQVNRSGTGTGQTIENINNYDTQAITLTVTNGAVVNLAPIAVSGTATAQANQPTTVQLQGNNANPQSGQTLTYTLLSQPQHGTISNFNAATGTFTYTPNPNYLGTDSLNFSVTDVGAPTPNLSSTPATETITVNGANTGAVRMIGTVLVVTPVPKAPGDKTKNVISVDQVNGNLQVTVNGQVDATAPAASGVDRIVVYGSKNGDNISVSSAVTIPTTLDGGHGHGENVLQAGGGTTREHGWFGTNTLQGGVNHDVLIGRQGRVKFIKSAGNDLLYAGTANFGTRRHSLIFPAKQFDAHPNPPSGTYYRFVGKKLVAIKKV